MAHPKSQRIIKVPAGTVIVREGESDTCAYVIVSGRVEVYTYQSGNRVVLAHLNRGQFFGEMNLILESVRTASVSAIKDTVLRVISREAFIRLLRHDPETIFPILRILFERLRTMNTKYFYIAGHGAKAPESEGSIPVGLPPTLTSQESPGGLKPFTVNPFRVNPFLEGITPRASEALRGKKLELSSLPFRIGRRSRGGAMDPLIYNDLFVEDPPPHWVSRNHCSINIAQGGGYFVQDRGSHLGTIVNGIRIGAGATMNEKELDRHENTLVLGSTVSPFQFRITFRPP